MTDILSRPKLLEMLVITALLISPITTVAFLFAANSDEKITMIVYNKYGSQLTEHALDDIPEQYNRTSSQDGDIIKTENSEENNKGEYKDFMQTITTTLASILGVFARKQIIQVIVGKIIPSLLGHYKSGKSYTSSSSNMLGIPASDESPRTKNTPWQPIQTESYISDSADYTKSPFLSYEKNKTTNNEQIKTNQAVMPIDYTRLHQIPRELELKYFNDDDLILP